mgnify:CR=1 FL=1
MELKKTRMKKIRKTGRKIVYKVCEPFLLVSHKVEKPIKAALFVFKGNGGGKMNNSKLMINTALLRKESEFRTKSCVVEKTIAVSHAEFDDLKRHPLRDNKLIAENVDLMYCDKEGNYHCLLIYDQEQGDGLLIESEGASYARYAQYISRAKELVEIHKNPEISLTDSEKKLCGLLNEMADRIVNAVRHGYRDFTIDDVLQDIDCNFKEVKEMITHAVAQKLSKMDGISSVEVSSLGVPFQPELTVITKEETEDMTADTEESMRISGFSM